LQISASLALQNSTLNYDGVNVIFSGITAATLGGLSGAQNLNLLNGARSGAFSPSIDSFGRVIFVRWDHLQRDQQADADNDSNGTSSGTFNYTDETAAALTVFSVSRTIPSPHQPTSAARHARRRTA
jgi:hypothetical protein